MTIQHAKAKCQILSVKHFTNKECRVLFRKGGGVMVTIMLFMAITSTGSAEQIAVSSLCAYDIYRKYFNPEATGADIVRVSRFVIFGFGIFMGVLSIGLTSHSS